MKILKWIGIIVLVLIVLAVIMPKSDTTTTKAPEQQASKSAEVKADDKITMEKFNKLEEGMTYAEVVAILGKEGEVSSSTSVSGYKTVLYTWQGSFGANMNAMFQNDKMISKAQFGLK